MEILPKAGLAHNRSSARRELLQIKGQLYSLRFGETDIECLIKLIDVCSKAGINTIFIELEKALKYEGFPKISAPWAISKQTIRQVLDHIKKRKMKAIPVVPSFSHCNYILKHYPEFSETGSTDIYCPSNKHVYNLIFSIFDEIIELFESDYFHIGHDEAISSYNFYNRKSIFNCPVCQNKKAHELFARDIISLYTYLKAKNIKTMMWADMLLDPSEFKGKCFDSFGCYGGKPDNLHKALELLPKDLILCDWHYEAALEYPTVQYLQGKGFNVIGASKFPVNTCLFAGYANANKSDNFLGMMSTSWYHINKHNFPYLAKWAKYSGQTFNEHKEPRALSKTLKNIKSNLSEASKDIEEGKFHRKFDFAFDQAGVYGSKGWTDFYYKEYPKAKEEKIICPSKINALELKSGRQGTIEYEFRTRKDCCFEDIHIKVWLKNLGSNSIEITTTEKSKYFVIAKNKYFSESLVDLTEYLKGKRHFYIRFTAHNTIDSRQAVFKRFDLFGTTVK